MARGTQIIVTTEPRGQFIEGIVTGTPKPGTMMEMTTAAISAGQGRFTWQASTARGTDGKRCLIAVLDADWNQGQVATTAYVTGTRCFIYCPVAGEEVNALVKDIAGTADLHSIGDYFIVDHTSGKLIATTGSPQSEPFECLEAVAAPTADTLVWCRYTGY